MIRSTFFFCLAGKKIVNACFSIVKKNKSKPQRTQRARRRANKEQRANTIARKHEKERKLIKEQGTIILPGECGD